MRPDHPEHDHAHPHDHNHAHGPHPTREDDDVVLSYGEARFLALKGLLIGKGIITADEVRRQHEINERGTPHQGARMVAKAWVDPAFKARMLKDAKAAAIELGIEVTEAELMAIENTPTCHNIIVCTLCSCYPRSLLGEPPAWYVSKAYRSRAVREPRKVLREFGLSFPDAVEVRVHDSNADLRYDVLPMRPRGRLMTETHSALDKSFRLEEATIDELHQAIKSGQTTCVEIVKQYIDRVCAFNGVASMLVTKDGAPIQEAPGMVRGKGQIHFPTKTVKASEVLPDLDKYRGQPIEFGRMETTASDPAVLQQFGMIVGIPKAGQLNALATLNIRGERSVTCRGDFDKPVSEGPLPPGAPAVCEIFRRMPDALEQAAELDATYGRTPDLEKMPMYGVVFSFKDPFDTKDMRSTGGGDARYDVDFPARDHVLVEQLRNKGAIIFAKAVNTEYNGRPDAPDGRHAPVKVLPSVTGYQRSTWGGNPGNPYDTTRAASLGSSSGSAVSVSANLVMCSLGEETRASCRGPANHNAVALILPHKAMLGFDGGAIGADIYVDRAAIETKHCLVRQDERHGIVIGGAAARGPCFLAQTAHHQIGADRYGRARTRAERGGAGRIVRIARVTAPGTTLITCHGRQYFYRRVTAVRSVGTAVIFRIDGLGEDDRAFVAKLFNQNMIARRKIDIVARVAAASGTHILSVERILNREHDAIHRHFL